MVEQLLKEVIPVASGGAGGSIITLLLAKYLFDKKNGKEDPAEAIAKRLTTEVEKLSIITTEHKILQAKFESVMTEIKSVLQAQTQVLQALASKITNS